VTVIGGYTVVFELFILHTSYKFPSISLGSAGHLDGPVTDVATAAITSWCSDSWDLEAVGRDEELEALAHFTQQIKYLMHAVIICVDGVQ
jgi:hypothetical protein